MFSFACTCNHPMLKTKIENNNIFFISHSFRLLEFTIALKEKIEKQVFFASLFLLASKICNKKNSE